MRNFLSFWLLLLLLAGCSPIMDGEVVLQNKTGQLIQTGTLEVSGQSFAFNDLPVGEEMVFEFKAKKETGYAVKVVLEDGQSIEGTVGYVTAGFAFFDTVIVSPSAIVLKDRDEGAVR